MGMEESTCPQRVALEGNSVANPKLRPTSPQVRPDTHFKWDWISQYLQEGVWEHEFGCSVAWEGFEDYFLDGHLKDNFLNVNKWLSVHANIM